MTALLRKNPLIRWGLPLVSFCVAGYFGLSMVSNTLLACSVGAAARAPAGSCEPAPRHHPRRCTPPGRRRRLQFMTGTVEVKDQRVKRRSERSFELERNHKVRVRTARTGGGPLRSADCVGVHTRPAEVQARSGCARLSSVSHSRRVCDCASRPTRAPRAAALQELVGKLNLDDFEIKPISRPPE